MSNRELMSNLFDLIGYMLTSARGLVDEPMLYGPFRLIDGVARLCGFLIEEDNENIEFYKALKFKIDEKKYTIMSDTEDFINMMDELVIDYTKRLKKR